MNFQGMSMRTAETIRTAFTAFDKYEARERERYIQKVKELKNNIKLESRMRIFLANIVVESSAYQEAIDSSPYSPEHIALYESGYITKEDLEIYSNICISLNCLMKEVKDLSNEGEFDCYLNRSQCRLVDAWS